MTLWPSALSALEIAAPMPRVPPVTIASRAIRPSLWSAAFDAHGNSHAAADAQRRQALARLPLLHLVEQRHQHPPARGADRMAERDRATIDVHHIGVPAEFAVDGAGLGGKGLVGLDEIEILRLPAGPLQRQPRRRDRARAHDRRIDPGMGP